MTGFKDWFNKIIDDVNYLGKDLSKEAWNHQQIEIEKLQIENNKITLENVKLKSICGDNGIDLSILDDPNDIYIPSENKNDY